MLWLFALCAKLFLKRPDLPKLVLAGRADDLAVLRILSNDPAWSEIAVFIENPDDAELCRLYYNARLCLYPSFEGGVGMSIMEWDNFDRPCIAARAPLLWKRAEPARFICHATKSSGRKDRPIRRGWTTIIPMTPT